MPAPWNPIACAVQPKPDMKSGDNDALKDLIGNMSREEHEKHIALTPQCSINSYLWRNSLRQWMRLVVRGHKLRVGFWRPGHFLVHMAGWNPTQVNFRT
jgi:hypothetical protein